VNLAAKQIRAFLRAQSGVNLGADKDYLIESRLHGVLKQHALPDLDELAQEVQRRPDSPLAAALIEALTTHETSWFRDQRPFERLRTEVLPRLRDRNQRSIRLWSAACSTGQEAYSLAILLREAGFCEPAWQVSLLASDLCAHTLAHAARGVYSHFEIERGLPEHYRERYFQAIGKHWEVVPLLRNTVRFDVINLIRLPPSLEPFDVIFCRNVLIYFDSATQQQVLHALHDRLRPGGALFLGAAESPLGLCDKLQPSGLSSGLYLRV